MAFGTIFNLKHKIHKQSRATAQGVILFDLYFV